VFFYALTQIHSPYHISKIIKCIERELLGANWSGGTKVLDGSLFLRVDFTHLTRLSSSLFPGSSKGTATVVVVIAEVS